MLIRAWEQGQVLQVWKEKLGQVFLMFAYKYRTPQYFGWLKHIPIPKWVAGAHEISELILRHVQCWEVIRNVTKYACLAQEIGFFASA